VDKLTYDLSATADVIELGDVDNDYCNIA